jgi:hypothetical protein
LETAAMLSGLGRSRAWWASCRSTCGRTTASGTCTREHEMRVSNQTWETVAKRDDEKT